MKAKADPVGDLAANQEVELKTKQRQFEAMRELFAYIRDHCDIPDTMSPLKSTEFCGSSFDRQAC